MSEAPSSAPITYALDEAAVRLGCTEWWLKTETRAKRIPFSRFGRSKRFTDDHLRRIAELMTVHPTGAPRPDLRAVPTIPKRRRKPA